MSGGLATIIGKNTAAGDDADHWLSVSDLMSGLMIVFLFIAIAMMHFVRVERDSIKEIAMAYRDTQVSLHRDLSAEFGSDLARWGAEIDDQTLEVRFLNPDMLFESGRADIKRTFRDVLADFVPRYLEVILRYRDRIEEVRIEGHTSSDWAKGVSVDDAYFRNMALSQARTNEVLRYAYNLAEAGDEREWVRGSVAAVGFSSARPVLEEDGAEDIYRSRRVSFRVVTDSETQIKRIINDRPGR